MVDIRFALALVCGVQSRGELQAPVTFCRPGASPYREVSMGEADPQSLFAVKGGDDLLLGVRDACMLSARSDGWGIAARLPCRS